MEPEIRRLAESVSERLVDQGAQATLRRRMLSAEEALLAVRAWRDGVLIDDPTGVGQKL